MTWQMIVGIALAIPVILLPVALVWYLNVSGIYAAVKARRAKALAKVKG